MIQSVLTFLLFVESSSILMSYSRSSIEIKGLSQTKRAWLCYDLRPGMECDTVIRRIEATRSILEEGSMHHVTIGYWSKKLDNAVIVVHYRRSQGAYVLSSWSVREKRGGDIAIPFLE